VKRIGSPLAGLAVALAPSLALASEHESETTLLWQWINLLLLLGVIGYFARAPLRTFLSERRQKIEEGIEGARAELAEVERRLAECRARVASIDRTFEEIRSAVRAQAESERARLLAEARAAAERIRRDAAAAVEQELRRARQQLHSDAAALAVRLAGDLLRGQLTDADRTRLVDDFVEHVERAPAPGGAAAER
jgi:F-type H+-transporting ATPase subunit b